MAENRADDLAVLRADGEIGPGDSFWILMVIRHGPGCPGTAQGESNDGSGIPGTTPRKVGLKRPVFRTAPEDTAIGGPFDAGLRGMLPARHSGKRATLWRTVTA